MWDSLFSNHVECDPAAGDLPALPGSGGVYLLTDEQDRLIQLASAADLKRAVLTRLTGPPPQASAPISTETPSTANGTDQEASPASPSDDAAAASASPATASTASRRRADLSTIVRRVRWQPAHSAFEIAYEYLRLSREILPDTYLKNLAFGPAWFVHVNPAAEIPRFAVTKVLAAGDGVTLGPFSTQQDANKFVQAIEDAFDLCRYIHILEQAPHGQPCAYHEMGRCPAPCGGLVPMSQYRESVEHAVEFATGRREATRTDWDTQMRAAAGELAFERAAALKQRIERARELDHAAYRFVRPVERFAWLVVQRHTGRTRVRPFFVNGGSIKPGEPAKLKDLEQAVPAWLAKMRSNEPTADASSIDLQERSEQIWLVSHFLFRREQTGLFFDAAALPDAARLIETIRDTFTPAAREAEPAAGTQEAEGEES